MIDLGVFCKKILKHKIDIINSKKYNKIHAFIKMIDTAKANQ